MGKQLSAVGIQQISDGRTWDEDRTDRQRKWGRLGWVLAIVFGVLFVGSTITGFVVWMKMSAPITPALLVVNKETGTSQMLEVFGEKSVTNLAMVHKNWAKNYVETCERYIPEQINNDYAACADMSESEALAKYDKIYKGPEPRHLKLRNSQTWTIEVLSTQLPPDASGIAIVRFKKVIWIAGNPSAEGIFTARFAYRFADSRKGTEREKTSNPLAYKVRSYIADADMGAAQLSGSVPVMVPVSK